MLLSGYVNRTFKTKSLEICPCGHHLPMCLHKSVKKYPWVPSHNSLWGFFSITRKPAYSSPQSSRLDSNQKNRVLELRTDKKKSLKKFNVTILSFKVNPLDINMTFSPPTGCLFMQEKALEGELCLVSVPAILLSLQAHNGKTGTWLQFWPPPAVHTPAYSPPLYTLSAEIKKGTLLLLLSSSSYHKNPPSI